MKRKITATIKPKIRRNPYLRNDFSMLKRN